MQQRMRPGHNKGSLKQYDDNEVLFVYHFFITLFFITWWPHYSQNRVKMSFSLIHLLAKNDDVAIWLTLPFCWCLLHTSFWVEVLKCWVGAIFSVLSACTPQILNELSTHVHRAAQHIRAIKFLYHIAPDVHLYHMLSIVCFHLYSWPLVTEEVPHFTKHWFHSYTWNKFHLF